MTPLDQPISRRRISLLIVALVLPILFIGCGGGTGVSPPLIDETLFVPNYVLDLNSKLYHWDHLPVRIAFDLPTNWYELFPEDPTLHVRAANEWNQPGKQALTVVVPITSQHDVRVEFVSENGLEGGRQGLTEYTHDTTRQMLSATIKVALYTAQGRKLSAQDLQATIAHEIGHGIGIGGHSPYAEDLMYPTLFMGNPQFATQRDLNTAMTAYPSYFTTRAIVPESRAPIGPVGVERDIIY